MATLIDCLTKGLKLKKPLTILWGKYDSITHLLKSPLVVASEMSPGALLAHAHSQPLFTEQQVLWVEGIPDAALLTKLCGRDLHQPIIFNATTKEPEPEFLPHTKSYVQVVSKTNPKAGSKAHKDFLVWYIGLEFPALDPKVSAVIAGAASQYFGDDLLHSADNLRKLLYRFPQEALSSVSSIKSYLVSIHPEKWPYLLEINGDPLLNLLVDTFYSKSRNVYALMNRYLQVEASPLPLLHVLMETTQAYLETAWAIKEAQGKHQDPQAFVQGRRVPLSAFSLYQAKVGKIFGERILWGILKDLCIIQSRYRMGEKSTIPIYSLLTRYVGYGI